MSFTDWLWSLIILFFWVMAITIWFRCIFDLFSRDDLAGVMKLVWIIVIIIIPFLGCLAYIVLRPKVTASDVQGMARAEAANRAVSGVSTADELAKLAQLRDAGAITIPEYDALKAKLLA